jgi:hypothetical protein
MAKIPLPERGQPLDLSYIYQVANAVNELSNDVSSSVYKYVTVDNGTRGSQSVKASESRIIAASIDVANNSTVSAGNERSFFYNFSSDFKFPPIVTATIVNLGNTPAGKNASLVLQQPTTSRVDGVVRFEGSGNVSILVNIIAIGIPN